MVHVSERLQQSDNGLRNQPNARMSGVMYDWRIQSIRNALKSIGKETGDLTIADLTSLGHLDQYHYRGVDACDEAIATLGLNQNSCVLDVGSGVGGPARYLAHKTGCSVLGIELQDTLSSMAAELTTRVGLQSRVNYLNADISTLEHDDALFRQDAFDYMVSWLVFLHVCDRKTALKKCCAALTHGGKFLIEDFVERQAPTPAIRSDLVNVISAPQVTSIDQYRQELEAAGFVDIEFQNLTSVWQECCRQRHQSFVAAEADIVQTHGYETFKKREFFYRTVDGVFSSGYVGGVRITGRRG